MSPQNRETSPGLPFSVAAATSHLRAVDPLVARLIDRFGPYDPRRHGADPYAAVLRSILYQQLAGPAAAAIERRFLALFGEDGLSPTPAQILGTPDADYRGAGVSRQKVGYMRDLAARLLDGRLGLEGIDSLPDDGVIERLTSIKGVGEWTAHMFLIFQLSRPDVLPVGDLGVRRGMKVVYGLEQTPSPAEALTIGRPWAPYRSVGSWYMWRATEIREILEW